MTPVSSQVMHELRRSTDPAPCSTCTSTLNELDLLYKPNSTLCDRSKDGNEALPMPLSS